MTCARKEPSTSTSSRSFRRDASSWWARRRLPSALARLARSMDYDVMRVVDASRAARHRAGGRGARRDGCRRSTRSRRSSRGDRRRDDARSSSRRKGTTTRRRSKRSSRAACRTSAWSRRASAGRPCARCSRNAASPASRRSGIRRDSIWARGLRPEVALSILAEIVQPHAERHAAAAVDGRRGGRAHRPPAAPATAVDPVCGMQVDDGHRAPHGGRRRHRLLLLLRELPRALRQAPAAVPGPSMIGRRRHPRPLPRARASSSTRRSRPRCRSCSRWRSRC